MIKSMTGFGRQEVWSEDRKFTVELKSVNHRYLDVNVKMPKKLNFFETALRNLLKQYAIRGKVDVFITYEDQKENNMVLKYNEALAQEYMKVFTQMSEKFDIENNVKVSTLSRFPEILMMEEQTTDKDELWSDLEEACQGAFAQFLETRVSEGERLKVDLLEKLDYILKCLVYIETRNPEIIKEYRMKIEAKVEELLGDAQIDEARIATEIVLFSDRICTDEETVRLRSHIQHMKDTLEMSEGIGRKLDFIAQEMNREANTILSKANDMEISNHAIELKTEIEKIREQIQNIE